MPQASPPARNAGVASPAAKGDIICSLQARSVLPVITRRMHWSLLLPLLLPPLLPRLPLSLLQRRRDASNLTQVSVLNLQRDNDSLQLFLYGRVFYGPSRRSMVLAYAWVQVAEAVPVWGGIDGADDTARGGFTFCNQ
jgi:hypothetical protein